MAPLALMDMCIKHEEKTGKDTHDDGESFGEQVDAFKSSFQAITFWKPRPSRPVCVGV